MNTKIALFGILAAQIMSNHASAQINPYGGYPGTNPGYQGQMTLPVTGYQGQSSTQITTQPGMATITQMQSINVPQVNPASPVSGPAALGGVNVSYYSRWCDRASEILAQASADSQRLYGKMQYAQAKIVIERGFDQAILATVNGNFGGTNGLPGTFRPYTYQELARSIELINTLENSAFPNQIAHDKIITYVANIRAGFVSQMHSLDQEYVIPCVFGCNWREQAARMNAFETKLVHMAREQLESVQSLGTTRRNGQVYPLGDENVYFTILNSVSRWVAMDLSYANFSSAFSCAIMNLFDLGNYAYSQLANFGGPDAVNNVSDRVDSIIQGLSAKGYGCSIRSEYEDEFSSDEDNNDNRTNRDDRNGHKKEHRDDKDQESDNR